MARGDLAALDGDESAPIDVRILARISLLGGFVGALLLLVTPPGVFTHIVPWLRSF